MKKWCLIILAVLLLAGCGVETQDEERLQDLDFTVMDLEKVPEELRNVLEEKKSIGYSISVKDLYLTKNAIYVDTELMGPGSQEQTAEAVTCPYIVLKLEYLDKSVVFE